MSSFDSKKTKRRKSKKSPVVKTPSSQATCQNFSSSADTSDLRQKEILTPAIDTEFDFIFEKTLKKLEKLMDAKDDSELPTIMLPRGPNPYLDKERCLLCGCERIDPPEAAVLKTKVGENRQTETNPLSQLPLWVCPDCRKTTDQEMEKKVNIESFMDQDLPPEPATLPFLDGDLTENEPVTPDGSLCNCEACTERREIETEHERETQELQKCWTELRKLVRTLYGKREEELDEDETVPDDETAKELVTRLCGRDPHQLFLRLESQVREFVIEMKVKLLKQLNSGFKTPPEAKEFISMLLEEYSHLSSVAKKMAEILTELKNCHLAKFNVTWELHNKHLFQSIAYTEPSIQSSLHLIITQLRLGAASKEAYNEDTYPNLLHRYLKFDDEMSVISVVWRDSQQLIEQYNEEQAALKLKQKMLKEDWEFFKAQRKILEQQVAKNSKSHVSHSFEAQFTETMRLMLQGSKPAPEECHCPRCNRKRCPCDECTITHMITCGIINPEALEATNSSGHVNFLHDPNRYRIDVSPPSMSSTTSSSGSSSPIMVDPERLTLPFDDCNERNADDIPEEIEGESQSGDEEDAEDDDDDDDDDDLDDDDDDDIDDEDDDEGDDEDDDDDDDDDDLDDDENETSQSQVEEVKPNNLLQPPELLPTPSWVTDPDASAAELISTETCDCYHCVSQAQAEQLLKSEDNQCQCYVCLRQRGKTISTSLPQHVPPVTSRPGELHLYPHIHGSAGLHGMARTHVRPLLQPQLYDLHMPIRQPKPIMQGKVPLKLDFDSPEGIHEHFYHAYGEWDNTYDPRVLLPKYSDNLGTELLPPPPLSSNFTTNFLTEPFSISTPVGSDTCTVSTTSTPATSAFNMPANNHLSSATNKGSEELSSMESSHDHFIHVSHSNTTTTSNNNRNISPPCTRPVTLGGNVQQQKLPQEKGHSQHCKRHNSGSHVIKGNANNSQQSHNHVSNSSSNLPVKVTQEFIQTAARNIREGAKEGMQMIRQFANSLNANVNTHTCNHAPRNNATNHTPHQHQTTCSAEHHANGGICPNAVSLPGTVNNVSVGTSTMCTEPDCEGHCVGEDNCDSVDDSCSEQSSSASTSNQKEGKYCDCCYCEFFGHGNPPVAPTSKNYAEIRDRLRLRLKRKVKQTENEQMKQEDFHHVEGCNHKSKDPIDTKGLDELIKFINGTEEEKKENAEKLLSAKAAKRARQKQRKAEEKARIEAEKLREKLRKERAIAEREKENNRINAEISKGSDSSDVNANKKKKKKKQKDKLEEETNIRDQKQKHSENLIREPPAGQEDDEGKTNLNRVKATARVKVKSNEIDRNSSSNCIKVRETISKKDSPPPFTSSPSLNGVKQIQKLPEKTVTSTDNGKQQRNTPPLHPKVVETSTQNKNSSSSQANKNSQSSPVTTPKSARSKITTPNTTTKNTNVGRLENGGSPRDKIQGKELQKPKISESVQRGHVESMVEQTNKKMRKIQNESQSVPKPQNNQVHQSPRQLLKNQPPPHINGVTPEIQQKHQPIKSNQSSPRPVNHIPVGIKTAPLQPDENSARRQHLPLGSVNIQDNKKSGGKLKKSEDSPPSSAQDQGKMSNGKSKKNKKKNRNSEDISVIDEIFMPKSESDLENGDMDEVEKELEEFKRFCLNSPPAKREKVAVNMNIKDIFMKKKSGLGCS